MKTIDPKLPIALVAVIALALFLTLSNPHKKYSRQKFWASATVEDVRTIAAKALTAGNRNGPVLMWAAATTKGPGIIAALIARGADTAYRDLTGQTAFEAAVRSGHAEIAKVLEANAK